MAWSSSLFRRLATATQSMQTLNLRNSLTSSLSGGPSKASSFHSLAVNTAKDRLHSVTSTTAGCQSVRLLSTSTQEATEAATAEAAAGPSFTKPTIIHGKDGRQFAVFDTQKHPKLKPSIVRRRLNRMRIFDGAEKNIRHSPWRLNLVCQLVAGLPFQEAMTQLDFCKKSKAPLVQKMLQRTANLADIRHGLQPSQLEIAECFATRGTPLKRVKTMGRGRSGRMEHKHSHMRVVLREVDFKLRIYQAPSVNQKKKWFMLQQNAEKDSTRAKAERDEIRRLEKATKAAAKKASA
jgi:large subunit ribosomal protein L22